jgi:glycosyltransferase involved in cell wall biosynthesis
MKSKENLSLVSVIIPTRDRPSMLTRAVKSVARQTYRDIEVIIVDDGSKYDVEARSRNGAGSKPFRIIKNSRTPGAAGARNTGFYQSRGGFIAFLDDDDEWMPEKISKQISAFETAGDKIGIVCTGDIVMHGGVGETRSRDLEGDVFQTLCRNHVAGNTSNPLIKRHVLEAVGLFDENLSAAQDTDLWIRIAKQYHFRSVNETLTLVHRHEAKRIGNNNKGQILGICKLLRKHWPDLPADRKYRLIREIMRLSIGVATQKF